jgi:flagellar hook-associated protein 3 FlgL
MAVIRTTYHGRLESVARQTRTVAARMSRAQIEAASGLRYHRASDDPSRTTQLHRVREQRSDVDVYVANARFAVNVHDAADDAIGGMADSLAEARMLAVQLSSDTYNDQVRIDAATSAQAMLERVLIYANTNLGGRYIFAGENYDAEAYDPTTGAYLGDTNSPDTEIGAGLSVQTGFDGSALFQGGGDVMGALGNLVAALATGDANTVRATLTDLDAAIDQLAEARTIVGGEMQRADDAVALNESVEVQLGGLESDLADADSIEAYTRLYEAQTAFEAALQVTANTRTNLLFMRL